MTIEDDNTLGLWEIDPTISEAEQGALPVPQRLPWSEVPNGNIQSHPLSWHRTLVTPVNNVVHVQQATGHTVPAASSTAATGGTGLHARPRSMAKPLPVRKK
ncbi:hypothetical protein AURDEDRAFT_164807 [Auricularia subglabra TFB-10046 SS5]|nr:hypothetical protein AURDEDRAFT_164807 [Auricularia subglabra TFB-10046 SS5]